MHVRLRRKVKGQTERSRQQHEREVRERRDWDRRRERGQRLVQVLRGTMSYGERQSQVIHRAYLDGVVVHESPSGVVEASANLALRYRTLTYLRATRPTRGRAVLYRARLVLTSSLTLTTTTPTSRTS